MRVLPLLTTISNPQTPKSMYPIYLPKYWQWYKIWWVSYKICNPTCSPNCMRFDFPTIVYSHAQGNFLQSCTATQKICRIAFHIAACYDKHFITFAIVTAILTFFKYVKEPKLSWKLVVRYWNCLNMVYNVSWDICFLCSLVVTNLHLETTDFWFECC